MTKSSMVRYFLAVFVCSTLSRAQVMNKKSLTEEGAQRVLHAAILAAKKAKTSGVIAVVDDGGNLMAFERLDGAAAGGATTAIDKARAAALSARPAKTREDANGAPPADALEDITSKGGLPISVDGEIVGAIGVSGALSLQQDDELARAGAVALSSGPAPVSFFSKDEVQAAFAKGLVLFNASDKYEIHASRREKPGIAETHGRDADIIYVLQGEATLVTGGSLVDQTMEAPDESRGIGISGGETRHLTKGDVLIIPAGVPHWFKEVTNPFLYYVVKAR
jgi:uncharacterized protein GlcG (DUF336 family)/mannose-6-phosphate isomerase-like protein (cupin superfamily)